jgi:dihydrofolate reductase
MAGPPAEIVSKLSVRGTRHVYVDGGITIQGFLRAGLVRSLTVSRVPILIGDGIPLFGQLPHDIRLRHVATQSYAKGVVKTEYEVIA